jgi:hypothetical protein
MLQFVLLYFRAFPESAGNSLQHFCNLDRLLLHSPVTDGSPLPAALVYRTGSQPRWYKHPYRLPETLIKIAQPVSAMLKIICIKLIPWDGIIDAFGHQKTGASRRDSRCYCRVVRLVADGAAAVCQLGRGRFEPDRSLV